MKFACIALLALLPVQDTGQDDLEALKKQVAALTTRIQDLESKVKFLRGDNDNLQKMLMERAAEMFQLRQQMKRGASPTSKPDVKKPDDKVIPKMVGPDIGKGPADKGKNPEKSIMDEPLQSWSSCWVVPAGPARRSRRPRRSASPDRTCSSAPGPT